MKCEYCEQEIDGIQVLLGWQEGLMSDNEDDRVVLTSICTECM